MALERRNPLPEGVYWVDVFGDKREPFNEWLGRDSVRVLKTRTYDDPPGDWLLFEVTEPTPWEGPGFPTIAPVGRETEQEDTVQRPPPQDFDEVWNDGGMSFGSKVVLGGVALGLGIYLLRRKGL